MTFIIGIFRFQFLKKPDKTINVLVISQHGLAGQYEIIFQVSVL